jgi:hypothetical protein
VDFNDLTNRYFVDLGVPLLYWRRFFFFRSNSRHHGGFCMTCWWVNLRSRWFTNLGILYINISKWLQYNIPIYSIYPINCILYGQRHWHKSNLGTIQLWSQELIERWTTQDCWFYLRVVLFVVLHLSKIDVHPLILFHQWLINCWFCGNLLYQKLTS